MEGDGMRLKMKKGFAIVLAVLMMPIWLMTSEQHAAAFTTPADDTNLMLNSGFEGTDGAAFVGDKWGWGSATDVKNINT